MQIKYIINKKEEMKALAWLAYLEMNAAKIYQSNRKYKMWAR
jgi:hypothetical protein